MDEFNISKTRTNLDKLIADSESAPKNTLETTFGCSGPKPCILV